MRMPRTVCPSRTWNDLTKTCLHSRGAEGEQVPYHAYDLVMADPPYYREDATHNGIAQYLADVGIVQNVH